jgi:hypothetical protein
VYECYSRAVSLLCASGSEERAGSIIRAKADDGGKKKNVYEKKMKKI